MLFATTFVMLQTPATGFAQGGLVRRKNAMSVIGQSFVGVILGCLQWYIWGYSLTFGTDRGNGFIGDPSDYAWFENVHAYDCKDDTQTIPHLLYAAFQMTFALMVPVLVTGAWAEKFHFFSACLFMIIWPVLVYYPTAHWIWGGGWLAANPDDPDESRAVDYAGGVVIHTSSGIASLVVASMLQKRRAFKKGSDEYTSNLPLTMVGVALVWVGWYSFNGGSGLRANGQAISALFVTQIAACTSALTWGVCSYFDDGYVQITHIASGALAGLAGITPGSGYVSHIAGVPTGIIVGLTSFYGGKIIKDRMKLDDVLDVTSLQAIPGAVGSILVGFFADTASQPCAGPDFYGKPCENEGDRHLDGLFYGGDGKLLAWQIAAVVVQIVWTAVMTWVTMTIIKIIYHIDVPPEYEEIGLDRAEHGEKAYDLDFESKEEGVILAAKLCSAAAKNDLEGIKKLVRLGANPAGADVDGRTALHLAARYGNIAVMKYLVNHCGADVNAADHLNSTPLRDATKTGQSDAAEWLRNNGATAISNDQREDLLHAAAAGNADTVLALLAAGVDATVSDYDGRTALHLAACGGHVSVVAALLKNNADVKATDRFGSMPIQDAQRYKHTEVEALIRDSNKGIDFDKLIVRQGGSVSDISHSDSAANRELLEAAQNGDLGDLKRLKVKRANLLSADYDGRTALIIAAKYGHLDCVKFLAGVTGQNINVQDNDHRTALSEAILADHKPVVDFLKAKGATLMDDQKGSSLCKAAYSGDLGALKQAKKDGTNLSTADYDGRTAMHLAACAGHAEIISWLAENGAQINATDRWGGTPLEDALRQDKSDVVRKLLLLGAVEVSHSRATIASENELAVHPEASEGRDVEPEILQSSVI